MARITVKNLVCIAVMVHASICSANGKPERKGKLKEDGDIIFGGLFPMHEKGKNGENCGLLKKEKGIQRLEAMLFAINRINRDPKLLPNLKIGVHILDTCSFDTYALEQCMDFIKAQMTNIDIADYRCQNGSKARYRSFKPVTGVIGAAASTVSIMVANILRLFKIPQISYASTSTDLSDKSRFEYFSRVVPPDSFQASAMVDLAQRFGWNYVSTLADDGNYGERGVATFEEKARRKGICIAQSKKISRTATNQEFDTIVTDLLSTNKAKAVIMFVNEDNCRNLLAALKRLSKPSTSELTFLASDSWGAKIHPVYGQEVFAEGTVTLLPKRQVIKEFDEYFRGLQLSAAHTAYKNPWFVEYWESIHGCALYNHHNKTKCTEFDEYFEGLQLTEAHRNPWFINYWEIIHGCALYKNQTMTKCTGKEDTRNYNQAHYEQEGLVQFVIDSVYALAHAVHNLLYANCPSARHGKYKACLNNRSYLTGEHVLKYIRNVSFRGIGGDLVQFDERGDAQGRYDIFQYQHITGETYDYVQIGEWTDRLNIYNGTMKFRRTANHPPRSRCSEDCPFGFVKNNTIESDSCCWVCIRCREDQILKDEYTCQYCQDGFKPNTNLTACVSFPVLHLDLSSLWVVLPVSFSSLGILATGFVVYVFMKYHDTPLIVASGRELCYILLAGICLSYGTTFVILAKPTVILCTIKRFMLGISLCLIYATILVKTNRLYRIFNRGIKAMVKKPSYTSPKSQVFICLSLVSVQMVGGMTWLGFEKPQTTYEKQQKEFLVLTCKASQKAMLLSLLYNMFLIIMCTVFGFKTRKIPHNFHEAKYIAFTMYSTCIVWLAFIPIYFGASHDFKIELTCLCMCVSISATVAVVCLFGPKVYICLFQPHKNVRKTSSSLASATGAAFPRPCLPGTTSSLTATCNQHNQIVVHHSNQVTCSENKNGHVVNKNMADIKYAPTPTAQPDYLTAMFSDSLEEEEDEEEICDENSFIPKPTEDKATSTSDTW